MLTGAIIILAELVALFRLALPDFISFGEDRWHDFYGTRRPDAMQHPFGDFPDLKNLNNHNGSV